MPPKSIKPHKTYSYKYSICTLVTDHNEYNEMVASFTAAGFTEDICEFLYADNSTENIYDAYSGINRFIQEANGKYIIFCHQDILLHDDDIRILDNRINQIDSIDPKWAVLSNAGGINLKHIAMHVTQKSGNRLFEEQLPLKSITADENFILVKNDANLSLSADLNGFHLYGTDLCLIADVLGYRSYVIDFNLLHKSDGNADKSFYKIRKDLKEKYRRAFRGRFLSTTITRFYISNNWLLSFLINNHIVLFVVILYYRVFKPKNNYAPKK